MSHAGTTATDSLVPWTEFYYILLFFCITLILPIFWVTFGTVSFFAGDNCSDADEAAKELEHTLLQNAMDKEKKELNKRLDQKEAFFI